MNVISKTRLMAFVAAGHPIARGPLTAWYKTARQATWRNFADVRETFGSADAVGNCVVFDIGGNKFRVIARIGYSGGRVYVLRVMTHTEYDRDDWAWANDCGCYRPPPKRRRPKGSRR